MDDVTVHPGTCSNNVDPCYSQPCNMGGTCSSTGGIFSCNCNPGYLENDCSVIDKSNSDDFLCDYEADTSCIFNNVQGDDLDWRPIQGPTPSSDTGPTAAASGTKYVYLEASLPSAKDDVAVMDTTKYKLPSGAFCLSFSFHMMGNPGSLVVSAGERNGNMNSVLTRTGDQGFVATNTNNNYSISIKGVRGTSWQGDIGVDSILLTKGPCSNIDPCGQSPCLNGGQCFPNYSDGTFTCSCTSGWIGDTCQLKDVTMGDTFTCEFTPGENECVFTNTQTGDTFDWTLTNVKTLSSSTGPDVAYSGEYYAFTEASSPRQPGDVATFTSSTFKLPDSPLCMQYHYHMYSEPGSLVINAGERGNSENQIENWTGNQGEQWHSSIVQIPQFSDAVISIKGIRGPTSKGDIGLDLITLQKGLCSSPCGSFPCQNGGICTGNQDGTYQCSCKSEFTGSECQLTDKRLETSMACDFEDNEVGCIFENSLSYDDFDWRRRTVSSNSSIYVVMLPSSNWHGTTSSVNTGPINGAESGSYYMYTEASSPRNESDFAVMDTINYRLKDSAYCLSLSINMRGQPGELVISAEERTGSWYGEASYIGHQGDDWFSANINIPQISDPIISIIGYIGSTSKGDIAIDHMILTEGQCKYIVD
ncbi:unnamed protein product [Mytilus edulis]|uniref:Uncharacterized protein n=1 Tax=Mytilus edulis TaxID=6550 RepID=A0A8S3SML3_MYTED|nr:unnamed protein product [Mytilus edulis]